MHELISPQALMAILRSLPAGVTELACHPGYCDDLDTTYRLERSAELRTLCDPALKRLLRDENIELCSFTRASEISRQ